MKPSRLLLAASLSGIGLMFAAPTAHATLVYSDGDLLLGFHATGAPGSTQVYLVDVGSFTKFISGGAYATTPGATVTLSLGNIGTDLLATYGNGLSGNPLWYSRSDLFWGISGVQKTAGNGVTANTLFASRLEDVVGVQSTPWGRPSLSGSGTPAGKLKSQADAYAVGTSSGGIYDQTESTNSTVALFQTTSSANNYSSFQFNGTSSAYSYFPGSIEGTFANGTSGSVLDLYEAPFSATAGSPSTYLGSFRMTDSGTLTFTSAVPEPSTFGMLGLGVAALGFVRRNRIPLK